MSRRAAAGVVLALVAAGCQFLSPNGISTGEGGLRTFDYQQSVLCTLEAAADPVIGRLAGAPDDRERVWLEAEDGRRLSVVWPRGFSVRFDPGVALFDEQGTGVARAGDRVEFGQVNVGEHAGTWEDPYFARGLVFRGCYPRGR